jgi:hypothetical protein
VTRDRDEVGGEVGQFVHAPRWAGGLFTVDDPPPARRGPRTDPFHGS